MVDTKLNPVCPDVFSEILKYLHEGVVILSEENIVELANATALEILGVDIVGRPVSRIPAETDQLKKLLLYLTDETGSGKTRETDPYTYKDHYSVRVFRGTGNSGSRKMVLFQDTRLGENMGRLATEQNRTLKKTNIELDQFAHIVSHDLKAPLRAISNLSLWLEEDLGSALSGENRDNFAILRARVLRMEALINGILEYSKVGREEVANESIDVYQLLGEVIELLAPPANVTIRIDQNMPILEAPKVMLLQVFSNLISNAIKYNDKSDATIAVFAVEKENSFEFVVEDNGPGIAPEYHEKIFRIFQTLQSRDKFESTGIGLTIVRRILEARGGLIRVESDLGIGSKFIFSWPR